MSILRHTFLPSLIVVYLVAFLQGTSGIIVPGSSLIFKEQYGLTDSHYGQMGLFYMVSTIFAALGTGWAFKRMGLKRLFIGQIITMLLAQVSFCGLYWSSGTESSYWLIALGTSFLGVSFGIIGLTSTLLPIAFFPERRHASIAALTGFGTFGLALGPVVIGWLGDHNLWIVFPLMHLLMFACISVITMLLVFPTWEDSDEPTGKVGMGSFVRSRLFLLFSIITVLYAFIQNSMGNWIVLHLTEEKYFPLGTASLGLSLFWGSMALGRLCTSALVLRVAPEKVWMTLPCLMAVVFLMFQWMQSIPVSLTVCFLIGLACSSFFPLAISLGTTRFEENKGQFSSLAFIIMTIGGGISSFLIGSIRDSVPLSSIFTVSAGLSVIIFILVTVFLNQPGKNSVVIETSSE